MITVTANVIAMVIVIIITVKITMKRNRVKILYARDGQVGNL